MIENYINHVLARAIQMQIKSQVRRCQVYIEDVAFAQDILDSVKLR